MQDSVLKKKIAFYDARSLLIWGLICILHILLVVYAVYSFKKVTPNQDQSQSNNTSSIRVQMLAMNASTTVPTPDTIKPPTPVITPPVQPTPSQVASTAKQQVEIITTKFSEKEATQNSKQIVKKESIQTAQSESAETKNSEKASNPTVKVPTHQSTTSSANASVSANALTTAETNTQQPNSNISQQNHSNLADSSEKQKVSQSEFKPLNRRLNYPTRARSLGVEGRIRVQFDISRSGTLTNIRILSENPTGVFTDAVLKDMARWRYQTSSEVKNQVVNIVFKLDGRVVLDH